MIKWKKGRSLSVLGGTKIGGCNLLKGRRSRDMRGRSGEAWIKIIRKVVISICIIEIGERQQEANLK